MRGKAFGGIHVVIRQRITPAYAGKSMELSSSIMVLKDHPRLCGEKCQTKCWKSARIGSPPPMRGKVLDGYKDNPYYRITPAYAGKRRIILVCSFCYRDHPRLCGEKVYRQAVRFLTRGSPPPMRGKAVAHSIITEVHGITPAYAGKREHAANVPITW